MATAFSDNELLQMRADTPAAGAYAHFSHGSCSLPPQCVFDAQAAWLAAEARYGTPRALAMFADDLAAVRGAVARLVGAHEHQIVFADTSSRAWALAFDAACATGTAVDVIATEHEWGANAMNLLQAQKQGRIVGLRVLYDGATAAAQQIEEALAKIDNTHMPLVALQAVNPVDGGLTDMSGIAAQVHDHGGLLFVDACQAAGQLPLNVQEIGCDVLVFPARKWLRGAKGVSVLFLSDRALALLASPPSLDIASAAWASSGHCVPHPDSRRFESYEFHPGVRLALKAASDYAMATGVDRIAAQAMLVRQKVQHALEGLPVLAALVPAKPTALMTYRIHAPLAAQLMERLEQAGINASLVTTQYNLWALQARGASVLLRLTPHYFTSDAEIAQLRAALAALPAQFRLPA